MICTLFLSFFLLLNASRYISGCFLHCFLLQTQQPLPLFRNAPEQIREPLQHLPLREWFPAALVHQGISMADGTFVRVIGTVCSDGQHERQVAVQIPTRSISTSKKSNLCCVFSSCSTVFFSLTSS